MYSFLKYYLIDSYIDEVIRTIKIINNDDYYVKIAVSWLISVSFVKYKEKIINLFKNNNLDKFIINKFISKINDCSRLNNKVAKEFIKNIGWENMNIEEDFNKRSIKQRKNNIYLSDEQIGILNKYNINYLNYSSINELIFDVETYLNESYQELDDLEWVSEEISTFNYYNNTNK